MDRELYLIVWGNFVKVGCSVDPIDRLARVTGRGQRPPRQAGDPELIATVPGGMGAEGWLHAVLAGHRAAGEWYHLRGPVKDLVEFAAANGGSLPPRPSRAHSGPRSRPHVDRAAPLRAWTSRRGEPTDRLRHAVATAEQLHRAVAACGAGVAVEVGPFDPRHDRACGDCLRRLWP